MRVFSNGRCKTPSRGHGHGPQRSLPDKVRYDENTHHPGEHRRTQKPAPKKTKSAAKSAQRDQFVWVDQIPDVLNVMVKALRSLRTERIWQTTAERDGLIS